MAATGQPNMNICQLVASQSNAPFANAADIQYDNQGKPYLALGALMVDHRKSLRFVVPNDRPPCTQPVTVAGTEDHPINMYHKKVFLDTGENIGVIHASQPERVLLKVAGGTPAMGTVDPTTGFRLLGNNSLKARLLDPAGVYYKWCGGGWAHDSSP